MTQNIKYGDQQTTIAIDGAGSTVTLFNKYFKSTDVQPSKVCFEIHERVYEGTEEDAIAKATVELLSDPRVLTSGIEIIHPPEEKRGAHAYFEIVKKFTVLKRGRFIFDD